MSRPSRFGSKWLGLALSVLLYACASQPLPSGGAPEGRNVGQGPARVSILRSVTLGIGEAAACELLVAAVQAQDVRFEVSELPAGLKIMPLPASTDEGGNARLSFQVSGQTSAQSLTVLITVKGQLSRVNVPIWTFQRQALNPDGLDRPYRASSLRFLPDGTALFNAAWGGSVLAQRSLLQVKPGGALSWLSFNELRDGEAISSQAVAQDGTVWVAVRGMSADGSYLLSRQPSGSLKAFAQLGAQGDNINHLTSTPDGRIWFTQYTRDRVAAFTPQTRQVQTFPVSEEAEHLIYAPDGRLYYAQFYAHPAIVQLDPQTGQRREFPVGELGRSEPRALAASPDGLIWFIESRSSTVWSLNPRTGEQKQLALPWDARPTELTVNQRGQVWVADPTNARLYTTIPFEDRTVVVGLAVPHGADGQTDGPRALAAAPNGSVWYEANGSLVRQVMP